MKHIYPCAISRSAFPTGLLGWLTSAIHPPSSARWLLICCVLLLMSNATIFAQDTVCDERSADCVTVGLLDAVTDEDGHHLTFKVTNNCSKGMSNVVFELPEGFEAIVLGGDTYQGDNHTYNVENPTNNPYYSVKFETLESEGVINGGMDVFSFTLPLAAPLEELISVSVKAGRMRYTVILYTTLCVEEGLGIGTTGGDSGNGGEEPPSEEPEGEEPTGEEPEGEEPEGEEPEGEEPEGEEPEGEEPEGEEPEGEEPEGEEPEEEEPEEEEPEGEEPEGEEPEGEEPEGEEPEEEEPEGEEPEGEEPEGEEPEGEEPEGEEPEGEEPEEEEDNGNGNGGDNGNNGNGNNGGNNGNGNGGGNNGNGNGNGGGNNGNGNGNGGGDDDEGEQNEEEVDPEVILPYVCGDVELHACICDGDGATLIADSDPCTFNSASGILYALFDTPDAIIDGDADDETIVQTSTDGVFTNVPQGDYVYFYIEYDLADASSVLGLIQEGAALTDILVNATATGDAYTSTNPPFMLYISPLVTVNHDSCECPPDDIPVEEEEDDEEDIIDFDPGFVCGDVILEVCACDSERGTLVADSDPCGFNSASGMAYVLVDVPDASVDGDEDDNSIVQLSMDGDFNHIAEGDYLIYYVMYDLDDETAVLDLILENETIDALLSSATPTDYGYISEEPGFEIYLSPLATINGLACGCDPIFPDPPGQNPGPDPDDPDDSEIPVDPDGCTACNVPIFDACTSPGTSIIICPEFCSLADHQIVHMYSSEGNRVTRVNDRECLKFKPYNNFVGEDVVTVVACKDGDCSIIKYRVTVGDCGDNNSTVTAKRDNVLYDCSESKVTIDILDNDRPLGKNFFVSLVEQPSQGTAVLNDDQTVTFTPPPLFSGSVSFQYQICNSDGVCDRASINISGDCACQEDLIYCIAPVSPLIVCPEFCDLGDELYIQNVRSLYYCSIELVESGCIQYQGLPQFIGEEELEITACDMDGVCETVTAFVDVFMDCEDAGGTAQGKTVNPATGETITEDYLDVSPSPATDYINVTFEAATSASIIEVHDIDGRLLHQERVGAGTGVNMRRIDVRNFPNQMYIVSVKRSDKVLSQKVVKSDR